MKRFFMVALLALFTVTTLCAQEEGIRFSTGKLQELLAKAAEEEKLLFVDFYAIWCPPCRDMNNNVFTQAFVGSYFNANCINVKMDGEQGEGPSIMKRYGITAYPTFLFLDAKGELIGKIVGGSSAANFLKEAQRIVDGHNQQ